MTDIENRKLEADIAKVMADIMKLGAEAAKLNKELSGIQWHYQLAW